MKSAPDCVLVLDNIRSAHNVGSLFRTADAVRVGKMYCVGVTPTPLDRFGRKRLDIAKVSLGGEQSVPWEHVDEVLPLFSRLKKEGFTLVALEQASGSLNYKTFKPKTPIALVVGNEVSGLSEKILTSVDCVLEIPMKGKKESLNVSVAAGIVLFRILDC